jgi:HEAT repeat protein
MKYAPALAQGTPWVLAAAAESLGQTVPADTKEEADKLIAVLNSGAGQKEKVDACRSLAVIGTKEAVPALAALLGDEKLSHMARYGLEPIPDPAVDEALRDALGRLKGRPLVGVLGSIGVRRDAKAVQPLAKMLEDPDADVVRTAARALGKIGTSDTAKLVVERVDGAPAALRPAVADACLSCAEALLTQGKRGEAAAIYERVAKADLPKHFRVAAAHGLILARQPADPEGTPPKES